MSLPDAREGRCPNCGANVEFKLGASRVTVCGYCQAVVARHGQDLSLVGKVAELAPAQSGLALGARGQLQKVAFEVLGRIQYSWKQGTWDEWYVGFSDGRWGWLAEAQGRFYLTFKVPPRPVPTRGFTPGTSVFLEGLGRFAVSDVKKAEIVGVQGELPDPVKVGETPLTVDLEAEQGAFATIDFGVAGDAPAIFVGREVDFEALKLGKLPGAPALGARRPMGDKLMCPNCGAPLTVRVPEQAVRVTCESCRHLLDVGEGHFRVIGAVSREKTEPAIPIGTAGTLRGIDALVVGFMRRSCVVDGTRYPWHEYLLFDQKHKSFCWLVESDGHWQLALPVSVASVHVANDADYCGHRFRRFSSVLGTVELVLGEFYWAIAEGDSAWLHDYIRPPEGLSCERTDDEVNWTHLDHLERKELAAAFEVPALATFPQHGVGAIQPWPLEAAWRSMQRWMIGSALVMFGLLFFYVAQPEQVLYTRSFGAAELTAVDPEEPDAGEPPPDARIHSFLSDPFEVGTHQALEIDFHSNVAQSWAYAAGAVINEDTGDTAPFGLEASYYSGVDDGESWSEGSTRASATVDAVGAGKAVVRADLQWDPKAPAPPEMDLRVVASRYSGWQWLLAFVALLWPAFIWLLRSGFESSRWWNSNLGDN